MCKILTKFLHPISITHYNIIQLYAASGIVVIITFFGPLITQTYILVLWYDVKE